MKLVGTDRLDGTYPDGYYVEYAVFDDSKVLWVTKKSDHVEFALYFLSSEVNVDSRKYDELREVYEKDEVQLNNFSECLTPYDIEEDMADFRILYEMTEDEFNRHIVAETL